MLYVIAFFSGLTVMALELLGPRLIAVYFGATIYSWSAIIGITLLGLAIGYAVGGKSADQRSSLNRLGGVLLVSAILIGLVIWTRNPVLIRAVPTGLRTGALLSAAILFLPAFICLGMVGPMCIRLLTKDVGHIGRISGNVFAVSTLGSVAGTLAAGFYLIPTLGLRTMLAALALIQAVLSGLVFVKQTRRDKVTGLSGLVLAIAVGIFSIFILCDGMPPDLNFEAGKGEILYMTDSLYGQIKIIDEYPNKYLVIENGVQGQWNYEKQRSQSGYVNFLQYLLLARPEGQTLLNIGLGSATIPKLFHGKYGIDVDVVELDPKLPSIITEYFDLQPEMIRQLYVEDGRSFINRTENQYDFIVLDAYIGGAHPWQLLSRESFQRMEAVLSHDGIFALSLPGAKEGPMSLISKSVVKTLATVFKNVRVYAQGYKHNESLFLILASNGSLEQQKQPKEITDDALALLYLKRFIHESEITKKYAYQDSQVITDDVNPVSKWEWRAIERWKKDQREQTRWDPRVFLVF